MLYKFIDQKEMEDVKELTLNNIYLGKNDDGQLVDIYDKQTGKFIGTYCTERFEIIQ